MRSSRAVAVAGGNAVVATLTLVFAVLLLLAVLISERASRTILSTAVLFLLGGFALGEGMLGVLPVAPGDPVVGALAQLALFSVLFTDGMKVGLSDLRSAWRLPGRALLLGLPLTLLITALLAHFVAGIPWLESFLLGAVLAPTDPVFAAAIVGRAEVPGRLRHLLNVESGLNDGLALPIVLVLVALGGGGDLELGLLAEEIVLGLVVGVLVPLIVIRLERLPFLKATKGLQPLVAVSIGLLVLAICLVSGANLFLAAFSAGITVATAGPGFRAEFEQFGELVSELLKLAAILVFGALITPTFLFGEIAWTGWIFAVLAIVVARPLALLVSFLGTGLPAKEQLSAMWFGPKGFASVVYGLLVLEAGGEYADEVFHLVALVIVLSILAHSSTDVLVAKQFERVTPNAPPTPG
ncbi:cation:proton antiporter [Arthrobacter sp. AL08]|uniref:cation:proton antiporter domain-containing protein n=1 Tax=unclassified Arthrobacter TaxID=235627 RepID=UPI00249B9C55|nr:MULTISPECIES: cation:proton antiporter [unclassified Arthrobacter]MDI3242310.1 cation:proton antiporter [Arthrobacter sp. AL05]MDI3278320.1 cation:proton antiporter [Arthrobacter sp. AL08]